MRCPLYGYAQDTDDAHTLYCQIPRLGSFTDTKVTAKSSTKDRFSFDLQAVIISNKGVKTRMKEIPIVQEYPKQRNASQFSTKFNDERCRLELLRFFSNHPHARFSYLAVVHAMDISGRLLIERSLLELIDGGLVSQQCAEDGTYFYSLA